MNAAAMLSADIHRIAADHASARRPIWTDALKAQGHTPALDASGKLDIYFHKSAEHNGPGCASCGWNACWFCTKPDAIPRCRITTPAE